MIVRQYLSDASLTISDGVISVRKIKLEGDSAQKAALFMKTLSSVSKYIFFIPFAALLFIALTIITAGNGKRIKRAGNVLFVPSVVLLIPGLVLLGVSFNATDIYRRFFSDFVFDVGAKAASVIGVHVLFPVVALLFVLALFGFILRRIARRVSDEKAEE